MGNLLYFAEAVFWRFLQSGFSYWNYFFRDSKELRSEFFENKILLSFYVI